MKNYLTLFTISFLLSLNACSQSKKNPSWGGTFEAPKNVSWRTVIPKKDELGEKLIISGTIFLPDGKTPAKNALVYVYHTNNKGIYPKKGNEKGNGKHHGYLRGWMKTKADGKYEFETIRPAPYQTHDGEPAHIHYTIEAPNFPEYWLTGLWFSDDHRVKTHKDKIQRDGGFSNITIVTKDKNGVLRGTRNIILQRFND